MLIDNKADMYHIYVVYVRSLIHFTKEIVKTSYLSQCLKANCCF